MFVLLNISDWTQIMAYTYMVTLLGTCNIFIMLNINMITKINGKTQQHTRTGEGQYIIFCFIKCTQHITL